MASPVPDQFPDENEAMDYEPTNPAAEPDDAEEEGDGEDTVVKDALEDSSEEEDEDEEEARRIREGFIVDDEQDDEGSEAEERARRRRRKKRRKNREQEDLDLDEDDFDLVAENTGTRVSRPGQPKLTRIRRGRALSASRSPSPNLTSRRAPIDDDLDLSGGESDRGDVARIWEDTGRDGRGEDIDMDDDDGFIDDEDEEEDGDMGEEEREARRRERRRDERQRRAVLGARPDMAGIDDGAWDEIFEVFGDGTKYDWALDPDDANMEEEMPKPEMTYHDVFEPSEIRERLLTQDDDLIRARDIPERMQLINSSLSGSSTLALHAPFSEDDLDDASEWVALRLGPRTEKEFFRPDGQYHKFLSDFILAVRTALEYLLVRNLEVPYIYTHRRDYISKFDPTQSRSRTSLIQRDELWRIGLLGARFRALTDRRNALYLNYERMGVSDEYFEKEVRPQINTVEMVTDVTEWLNMRHSKHLKDLADLSLDESGDGKKLKKPSRTSGYEIARGTLASQLAKGFGIDPDRVVLNFIRGKQQVFPVDQDFAPLIYAEQFVNGTPGATSAEDVLKTARMILATELGKDPLVRQEIRNRFKTGALVSVTPTEKGLTKIDENHPYYNFKYLKDKPASKMLADSQFLHILAAESDHLVTVSIHLGSFEFEQLEKGLNAAYESDGYSDSAKAWNEQRREIAKEAIEKFLLPAGAKWVREWIREEVEDVLSRRCADILEDRINVAPFRPPDFDKGDVPSVLAISWGKGDPQRDAIMAVFLDEEGRLCDHAKFDNLLDAEPRANFNNLIRKRKPDVIVVGGLTITTTKLVDRIKELIGTVPRKSDSGGSPSKGWDDSGSGGDGNKGEPAIPVIYVHDEVARMYQHSPRASEEFGALPLVGRYCVGLARYAQSPLNEYAALGADLTAITFDEDAQQLLSRDKLLTALERALVNVVNNVGVDVNRAVSNSYYQHLLPFVSGLGPRKAQALIQRISTLGGSLINREQFITELGFGTQIFINAAGFLRISQDEYKDSNSRDSDRNQPDPLDGTRIHPEDYELARKMATDALELDEEDVAHEHPSKVVLQLMQDEDSGRKLDDLSLDDFAINLQETTKDLKRRTLDLIKEELIRPFGEVRQEFQTPSQWEILTMLSGETPKTLRRGRIVSVFVLRIKQNFVAVKLDSGLEGIINGHYLADQEGLTPDQVVQKGQTIPAIIIDTKIEPDRVHIELSSRPNDVASGDVHTRKIAADSNYFDQRQAAADKEIQQRKKMGEVNRTRRVIKHPNFHNFKSNQAEQYLANQPNGDVVVRPSSKGPDHLAVTWKVDQGVYQHIDVVEVNADPSRQNVAGQLIIDGKYQYADLDELIVTHIKAMSRKVEDLMAHEKYQRGTEDELNLYLKNFVKANPTKSMYAFGLNRKRAGYFNLSFVANENSQVQTWPIKVTPQAYVLFDVEVGSIPDLCDAFKRKHRDMTMNKNAAAGGRTPYGAGRMTPGRATPAAGSRTPGYGTGTTPRYPAPTGSKTPSYAPTPLGAPTPSFAYPAATAASGTYPTPTFAAQTPLGAGTPFLSSSQTPYGGTAPYPMPAPAGPPLGNVTPIVGGWSQTPARAPAQPMPPPAKTPASNSSAWGDNSGWNTPRTGGAWP